MLAYAMNFVIYIEFNHWVFTGLIDDPLTQCSDRVDDQSEFYNIGCVLVWYVVHSKRKWRKIPEWNHPFLFPPTTIVVKRRMSYVLRTLSKKQEVDSIIRDTIDKVLVLRFGRASDSVCLQLDQIVCIASHSSTLSISYFHLQNQIFNRNPSIYYFHLCHIVVGCSFLKQQGMCPSLQLWHWLMLTLRTFKSMSTTLTSLSYHLPSFSSMPITWKWTLGMNQCCCPLLCFF